MRSTSAGAWSVAHKTLRQLLGEMVGRRRAGGQPVQHRETFLFAIFLNGLPHHILSVPARGAAH